MKRSRRKGKRQVSEREEGREVKRVEKGDEPSSHVVNGSSSEGRVVVSHPKEVSDEDGSTEGVRKAEGRSERRARLERESGGRMGRTELSFGNYVRGGDRRRGKSVQGGR